jgi:hypothetical protein
MRSVTSLGGALVIGALAVLSAAGAGRGVAPPSPRELLRSIAQVNDAEWAAVTRGEAVAKVLGTDSREVAVVGAVRIAAASERLADRYRDIENLKRSAIVLAVGRFSIPPTPADLASVPFEDYSLDVRDCRPGDCRVRLGEQDIARFQHEVDWRAGNWRDRSRTVWREILAGYATVFSRDGGRALPTFANKPERLSVPTELALLVSHFGFVGAFSTEFLASLRELGPGGPGRLDDVLYWTKEDFGIRPVLRLSYQTMLRTSGSSPVILIATNQIYADHYLDAALTLTMAIDASSGGKPAFYMIAVSRARTRSLGGLLRAFVRSTVQSRSREALRKILASTKASLEQPAPAVR